MSIGGHSLHKNDYLALGLGGAALSMPWLAPEISGLLGPAALGAGDVGAGVGASGLAEMAGVGAATPGISSLIGGGASAGKSLQALMRAQQLMALVNPQHGAAAAPQRRQQQGPQYSDAMKLFEQIYGGQA